MIQPGELYDLYREPYSERPRFVMRGTGAQLIAPLPRGRADVGARARAQWRPLGTDQAHSRSAAAALRQPFGERDGWQAAPPMTGDGRAANAANCRCVLTNLIADTPEEARRLRAESPS